MTRRSPGAAVHDHEVTSGSPHRRLVRRVLFLVLITAAVSLLTACSGSGSSAHTSAAHVTPSTRTSVASSVASSVTSSAPSSAASVTCVESEQTVARIIGHPLPHGIKGSLGGVSQCGYYDQNARGARTPLVSFSPFPSSVTLPTLDRTRASLEAIAGTGTAQDRKTSRITVEPAWGKGAFVNAYLLPGTADGTLEQVDAYTAHWVVALTILTGRFLAARELAWMNQLVHALT